MKNISLADETIFIQSFSSGMSGSLKNKRNILSRNM